MFNVGDRVFLLHSQGVHTLEVHKSYKITELDIYNGNQYVRIFDDFYNSKRFIKDIKYVRRKKIEKMNWKK